MGETKAGLPVTKYSQSNTNAGSALLPLFLLTCVGLDVAVVADVLLQGEPGQVEVVGDLHRVILLPLVLQVVSRPAV